MRLIAVVWSLLITATTMSCWQPHWSAKCAAIITGDQDLLIVNLFRGIQVLAPSAFWKWESEHG